MKRNLFAYGTLLDAEIWELVVGRLFKSEPATLVGYEIRRVQGGDFPGIFESEEDVSEVVGRIFYDLDEDALSRLDVYEDSFYERVAVNVMVSEEGKWADCYVIPGAEVNKILSEEVWSFQWFQKHARESYLERLRGWRG